MMSLAFIPLTLLLMAPATVAPSPSRKVSKMSFYDLKANTIDLTEKPLADWRGQVALVVNTASECGNTPQYAGLEKLWQEYKANGQSFVILGFPSNDFGGQEPGTEAEIKKFCSLQYKVTFPMFAKVKTRGDGQSPIYKFLTTKHDAPKWNFHKYLVGKDGQVIRAFGDKIEPDDKDLHAAIEQALK